jgi:hypothetical protein
MKFFEKITPLTSFVFIAFLTWVFIHLYAFLGFFFFLLFPLFYFLNKGRCLACSLTRKRCLLCRVASINRPWAQSRLYWFSSRAFLIFLLFLFSLFFVWLESLALRDFGYPLAPKSAVFEISPKGEYRLGEVFPLEIKVANINLPINAVQAIISFDPELAEVVDISTEGSFASIFIQKEINNEAGYVKFSGGLPNPGFKGPEGVFGKVLLKGKRPGILTVEFLPSSMVLVNDGRGTNILKESTSANYLILPEPVVEENEALTVLGEESEANLIFYEESPKKVAFSFPDVEKKLSLPEAFLDRLASFDSFVVGFWFSVFSLVKNSAIS